MRNISVTQVIVVIFIGVLLFSDFSTTLKKIKKKIWKKK